MIPPDRPFRRSARSRADLLYLLAQHASARHAELADLVGFEPAQRELPAKKQRPFPETDGQAGATEPTPPSIGSTKKPKARFFWSGNGRPLPRKIGIWNAPGCGYRAFAC